MRSAWRRIAAGLATAALAVPTLWPVALPAAAAPAPSTAPSTTTATTTAPTAPATQKTQQTQQTQAAQPPGITAGTDTVTLLGQSSYASPGHSWRLRVGVSSVTPKAERLRLRIYGRLMTQAAFDQTLAGELVDEQWHSEAIPLSSLKADPAGGVGLAIPVDKDSTDVYLPDFLANKAASGLFPVQVQLLDSQSRVVGSLVTFMAFAIGGSSQTGLPALDVSFSLSLGAPPPIPSSAPLASTATAASLAANAGQLSTPTVNGLAAEVAILERHRTVPLSLEVTPQTADALAALAQELPNAPPGSRDGEARSTLAGVSALVAGGDELYPATYVQAPLAALSAAGLFHEVDRQFARGRSALQADLHQTPADDTWMVDGPLDPTTWQILKAHGAKQVVLPSTSLRPLPTATDPLSVASPAHLARSGRGPAANGGLVDGADSQLDGYFSNSSDTVLGANQLLAQLELIQLEAPSQQRGVALVPPEGYVAGPAFLDTLLGGLRGNPLLQAVTAKQLFSLPLAQGSAATRSLVPAPAPGPLAGAVTITLARGVTEAYGSVLPGTGLLTAEMARRIDLAESSQLTATQRAQVLGPVIAAATPLDQGIALPPSASITLTARKGDLPLTLFAKTGLKPRVELRLSSDKLDFEPFSAPGATCRRSTSLETCVLRLDTPVTTLKIPVEARTSGVFTLNVGIFSPEGALQFATTRDTVHSTAVSGVGVIVIVLAILGLCYWWFRDLRHGRRRKGLVAVGAEEPEAGSGKGPPASGESVPQAPQDAFDDFFSRPPPTYEVQGPAVAPETNRAGVSPPVSPSRGSASPS